MFSVMPIFQFSIITEQHFKMSVPFKKRPSNNFCVLLPELSDDDISDIKFAIEQEVDAVFVSYVHGAECVHQVRQLIAEHSKPEQNMVVISKIEDELVRI